MKFKDWIKIREASGVFVGQKIQDGSWQGAVEPNLKSVGDVKMKKKCKKKKK